MASSNDGRTLVGTDDRFDGLSVIKLWNLGPLATLCTPPWKEQPPELRPTAVLPGGKGWPCVGLKVLSDGLIVGWSDEEQVRVWAAHGGVLLQQFTVKNASLVHVLDSGDILFSTDRSHAIVWRRASPAAAAAAAAAGAQGVYDETPEPFLTSLSRSPSRTDQLPDGRLVCSYEDAIEVWEMTPKGRLAVSVPRKATSETSIKVVSATVIVVKDSETTFRFIDIGDPVRVLDGVSHYRWPISMSRLPDGLIVFEAHGELLFVDVLRSVAAYARDWPASPALLAVASKPSDAASSSAAAAAGAVREPAGAGAGAAKPLSCATCRRTPSEVGLSLTRLNPPTRPLTLTLPGRVSAKGSVLANAIFDRKFVAVHGTKAAGTGEVNAILFDVTDPAAPDFRCRLFAPSIRQFACSSETGMILCWIPVPGCFYQFTVTKKITKPGSVLDLSGEYFHHSPARDRSVSCLTAIANGWFVSIADGNLVVLDPSTSRQYGAPQFFVRIERIECGRPTTLIVLKNGDLVVASANYSRLTRSRADISVWSPPKGGRAPRASPTAASGADSVLGAPLFSFGAVGPDCHYGGYVSSMLELADGALALSTTHGRIEIWELSSAQASARLRTTMHLSQQMDVRLVGQHPGGMLVTADSAIRLWDLASGKCAGIVGDWDLSPGDAKPHVAVVQDGSLVVGRDDRDLRVIDLSAATLAKITPAAAKSQVKAAPPPEFPLWAIKSLAGADASQSIARSASRVIDWPGGLLAGVAALPAALGKGPQLLIGGGEGGLALTAIGAGGGDDSKTGVVISLPSVASSSSVSVLAISDLSELLAAGFWDGTICVWDVAQVRALAESRFVRSAAAAAADPIASPGKALNKGGGTQAKASETTIRAELLSSERVLRADRADRISSLTFMRNRPSLVSASLDGVLRVWDSESGKQLQEIRAHTGAAWAVVALSSGDVVTGGADNTIRVWWHVEGDRLLSSPRLTLNTAEPVCSLAELPTGALAAGLLGHVGIEIWGISQEQQGILLRTLPAQGWSVWSLRALPGSVLASGHGDGVVCTWDLTDLASPKRMRAKVQHKGAVHGLVVLLDGRLASSGCDGRLLVPEAL